MQKLLIVLLLVATSCSAHRRSHRKKSSTPPSAAAHGSSTPPSQLKGEALRDHVNKHQSLWKAEVPKRTRLNHLLKPEHMKIPESAAKAPVVSPKAATTTTAKPVKNAPTTTTPKAATTATINAANGFDARVQWPHCPTIGYIRDQSECGCCWAFAASEVLSDRTCIASGGAKTPVLSAQDIMTCCTGTCGSGCNGGVPYYAWEWLIKNGASTGGGYYENFGCKPFSVQPCGTVTVNGVSHTYDQSYCATGAEVATPSCTSTCSNSAYNVSYASDKHYAKSAYAVGTTVAEIEQEIMTNGPVEAAFSVYTDFDQYVSGVYTHTGGTLEGGHAVRIIGWGTEDGTDYWQCANSWDTTWGENGFFRILKGVDECGIESSIVAGLANV